MLNQSATERSFCNEPESHDGQLVFVEQGLSIGARLVDGRIQVEVRDSANQALIARTAIMLPQSPATTKPQDPYAGGFCYPV